ncbi:hypothetical protein [Streptomyces sp. NPDC050355]|uniref:hypothetical protein n=1 Tax=Streptomyces sp. NPDC050355 TaxID=3365609 RepID=UPI003795BE7B
MNTEASMSLHEIAAEIGRGLLTQLPSALLVALAMTGLAAVSRRRQRNRARRAEAEKVAGRQG